VRWEQGYPAVGTPALDASDVERDLPKVAEIVAVASKVLDQMGPF
jgi:hypothetical protein